ncbi:MAG: 5,6-dimethylbenzimidazole synthase [Hyphomicrobiales bacterium]|nr:5,6-dimethylbenzimidazole synthase [Hyphomicrobiales bacterium]
MERGDDFLRQFDELLLWRRDVRRFRRDPAPEPLVAAVLDAARFAPSVGLSQPTRLMRVNSAAARAAVRENFADAQADALAGYEGERARLYARLKLSGLDEAPVHIAVFCDEATAKGHGLGARTMPETLAYSTVCGVMLMWLAAAARGLGLGWVSILDPARLSRDLDAPEAWRFIAYLCIGWPEERDTQPELEKAGWERRDAASPVIHTR